MESDDFLGRIEALLAKALDKAESIGNMACSIAGDQFKDELNKADVNYIMYQAGQIHGHLSSMGDAIKAWRADNGI